jgi:hypothetical protein
LVSYARALALAASSGGTLLTNQQARNNNAAKRLNNDRRTPRSNWYSEYIVNAAEIELSLAPE